MRKFLVMTAIATLACSPAYAQENAETPEGFSQDNYDEVIVFGTKIGMDKGLSAFYAGDYETAEIEFKKSFRRIKRVEMLQSAGFQAASQGAISAQIARGIPQVSGSANASTGAIDVSTTQNALDSSSAGRTYFGERKTKQEDKGYPLYMAGLSQIQLKKYDEAKASLKSALSHNKQIPDAYYRLAILELRDGNVDGARKLESRLVKATRKCGGRCDQTEEFADRSRELRKIMKKVRG